ncbi:MAG TPA: ABC transporter substrate-binding protein, partial [Cupriavidus sp.]|nr:ABC transporter substrate-binding protein [Cupriavidus sp.]
MSAFRRPQAPAALLAFATFTCLALPAGSAWAEFPDK